MRLRGGTVLEGRGSAHYRGGQEAGREQGLGEPIPGAGREGGWKSSFPGAGEGC